MGEEPARSVNRGKKVVAVAMDEKHVAMSSLADFEAMLGVMKTWHPHASRWVRQCGPWIHCVRFVARV
jgi:hypothetical protein